jgi:hypothetical protein
MQNTSIVNSEDGRKTTLVAARDYGDIAHVNPRLGGTLGVTMTRGTFDFEVTASGDLVDSTANVEALRKIWLDRSMVNGADLGPGDEGDFDNGAWHVACHLIGAGGVRQMVGFSGLRCHMTPLPISTSAV